MVKEIRALSLFPGIVSVLITDAQSAKNADTPIITAQDDIFEKATNEIAKVDTKSVFYAAQKLIPTAELKPINGAKSLLDQIIYALATQLTNDVISFVGFVSASLPEVNCDDSVFSYRDKADRYTPVTKKIEPISDELRDELSGANVKPGEGDDDCGDTCKV